MENSLKQSWALAGVCNWSALVLIKSAGRDLAVVEVGLRNQVTRRDSRFCLEERCFLGRKARVDYSEEEVGGWAETCQARLPGFSSYGSACSSSSFGSTKRKDSGVMYCLQDPWLQLKLFLISSYYLFSPSRGERVLRTGGWIFGLCSRSAKLVDFPCSLCVLHPRCFPNLHRVNLALQPSLCNVVRGESILICQVSACAHCHCLSGWGWKLAFWNHLCIFGDWICSHSIWVPLVFKKFLMHLVLRNYLLLLCKISVQFLLLPRCLYVKKKEKKKIWVQTDPVAKLQGKPSLTWLACDSCWHWRACSLSKLTPFSMALMKMKFEAFMFRDLISCPRVRNKELTFSC